MKKSRFIDNGDQLPKYRQQGNVNKKLERIKINKLKKSLYDPDFDYEAFYDN